MNRKSFLKKVSAAVLAGIPLLSLWNCSDSTEDDNGSDAKNCLENGTSVSIGTNHGHSLTVSKEDVDAGVEKSYSIAGAADHSHNVTVTADNFATLQNNSSVTVQSTSSGHTHSVTISCA